VAAADQRSLATEGTTITSASGEPGSDTVEDDPRVDAAPCGPDESIGEARGDRIVSVEVGLELRGVLRLVDRLDQGGEDLVAVPIHVHPVARDERTPHHALQHVSPARTLGARRVGWVGGAG
jgi:hypothetical protein